MALLAPAPCRSVPPKRPASGKRPAPARSRTAPTAGRRGARKAEPPRRGGVVAIGGSAGAIASLQKVLGGLPRDLRAPVLVVLHLDQDHPSHIAAILQRSCALPVREARGGEPLLPARVYVAPPGRHLEVADGRVRLSRAGRVRGLRPSVDRLFESVARDYGEKAVAVVLSGSGSDGAVGVLRVKEREGTTVAEDPSTAAYSSMPDEAGRTGAVDVVLPATEIARFVARFVNGERPVIPPTDWEALLKLLEKRFRTDFGQYKPTTLHRRLEKRLLATGHEDLHAYLRHVQRHPAELEQVYRAFLIKVSSFFRDKDAWRALQQQVVKPLARRAAASPGAELRVWSAGCATGEEAYSLAMMFLEELPEEARAGFKVFATDIDDDALEAARQGLYDAVALAPLTTAQRARFFDREARMFRVKKELRKHVIFGRHDLTRDPPIAGLDLLVCRNVLIYFTQEQKQTLIQRLAYAVKPRGYLFLGKSEGILEVEAMFQPLSTRARVFQRNPGRQLAAPLRAPAAPAAGNGGEEQIRMALREGMRDIEARAAFTHILLQSQSILLITLDADRRVTLWNRAAEAFFGLKSEAALGKPYVEVLEGVSGDRLSKAVKQALGEMRTVDLAGVPCKARHEPARYLDLTISPLAEAGARAGEVLLAGVDTTARHEGEARQRELLAKLRKSAAETARANEALQATNEELETLNEELQSAAEEQQTLNEELQSSNEELETTNEELQSTNEELSTLNEEMRVRTEELERVTSYLRGVLDSAPDSVIVCDDDDRITFWSQNAAALFRLSDAQAVGRDLFEIVPALDADPVRAAVRQVRAKREPVVVEDIVLTPGHTRARLGLSSVVSKAGKPRGYVLIVTDVTSRATREEEARRARDLVTLYNRVLTHDIGNLATGVATHLDLARDGSGEAARRHVRAAEGLLRRTMGMVRNVQILNEMAKPPRPRPVDAGAAMAEAVALARLSYPEAAAEVVNEVPKGTRVMADATLAQVFFNLVANAFEHGGRPDVRVRVTCEERKRDGAHVVEFAIRDDGRGLSPGARARLFEAPLAARGPGEGLGLYIARALVDAWGGTLRADDAPEGGRNGTVVRLALPTGDGGGKAREGPSR